MQLVFAAVHVCELPVCDSLRGTNGVTIEQQLQGFTGRKARMQRSLHRKVAGPHRNGGVIGRRHNPRVVANGLIYLKRCGGGSGRLGGFGRFARVDGVLLNRATA